MRRLSCYFMLWTSSVAAMSTIIEAKKCLPLIQDVDVVVVGGSSGAISAACNASQSGASVFVVAPRPYLGEDMAGTLALLKEKTDTPECALHQRIFNDGITQTTPLKIKKTLDAMLLQSNIRFLTGAYATEPMFDEAGKLSGIVIADRSGRQAIRAKVVIDATERAQLARHVGAKATAFPSGTYRFRRFIVAGEAPKEVKGLRVKERAMVVHANVTGIKPPEGQPKQIRGCLYECELDLPMRDGTDRSFANAEQLARDLTFVPTQLDSADTMCFLPPDWIEGNVSIRGTTWPGIDALNVSAFQPAGIDYLFVLGAMADVSREIAGILMYPNNLMTMGERIGTAAAKLARERQAIGTVATRHLVNVSENGIQIGENNQLLPDYLCNISEQLTSEPHELPVLADCDVVVAGAGTGGAPAGIAAARQGVRTIVCEYIHQMGGVQTDGLIGVYYYGNRVGFTSEIDQGVKKTGAVFSQAKSEWYRQQNRRAGAEIWYGTLVVGTVVEAQRLVGIVVVTPSGQRGVIRCKAAIDATGNADLVAMAGEATEFITSSEIALQGAGQTPRALGASYINTDVGFVDDTDAADLCFFALRSRLSMNDTSTPASTGNRNPTAAKPAREQIWDQAQIVNSRERRRMLGAFYMSPLDVVNQRTYPDVVVQTFSNFDSHGHTVHEQFFVHDPGHVGMKVNLPYRCLLPKKLDGLLVIGLGISAHRDAMPILRMQPDVQNQGYVVGVAAAMAIKSDVTVRNIDLPGLQRHLIDMKILPPDVVCMKDNFPLPDSRFTHAIQTLTNHYAGFEVLLTDPAKSLPLLKNAYRSSRSPDDRFVYAHILGMMGDPEGEAALIERIEPLKWDTGWNFRGMGQFGRSVSEMDSYVIALGRAKSRAALPLLLAKAKMLDADDAFSHFRAIAMAFERIGDPVAAPVLGGLLAKPTISGHAITMQSDLPVIKDYANKAGDKERTACLRELALARALYRLGDFQGRGEHSLRSYAKDPRRVYAKHAELVLAGK